MAPTSLVLDSRGQIVWSLLPEILADFNIDMSVVGDEIVSFIEPTDILEVCRTLRENSSLEFDYLRCLSVVDYIERLEIVYHLFSLSNRYKVVVKASVSPEDPLAPSVVAVWPGADWFEREAHDLFGVVFEGHPDLQPLLLYDGFEGFPGRKNFPFHEYDEW